MIVLYIGIRMDLFWLRERINKMTKEEIDKMLKEEGLEDKVDELEDGDIELEEILKIEELEGEEEEDE